MSERKNIDRLFQEKFKDFEVNPPENVWNSIRKIKDEKKDEKKIIVLPLWLKLCGLAAALLIFFAIGSTFLFKNKSENETINNWVNNDPESTTIESNQKLESNSTEEILNQPLVKNNDGIATQNFEDAEALEEKGPFNSKNTRSYSAQHGYANTFSSSNSDPAAEKVKEQIIPSSTGLTLKDHLNKENTNKNNQEENILKTSSEIVENSRRKATETNTYNASVQPEVDLEEEYLYENYTNKVAFEVGKDRYEKNLREKSTITDNQKSIAKNSTEKKSAGIKKDPSLIKNSTLLKPIATLDTVPLAKGKNEINPLDKLLKEKEDQEKKATPKTKADSKWAVTSRITPLYMNASGSGSSIDAAFDSNEKSYNTTLAYGVGATYNISKKIAVRAGINSMNMEYNTKDVLYYESKNTRTYTNINRNQTAKEIQFESMNNRDLVFSNGNIVTEKNMGSIKQNLGYIEIPTELSYKILDNRFGIQIIGGLSTLFLTENRLTLISAKDNMEIGEANNLNQVHFSTNIGLGFKYSLSKAIEANLEPMFKYQLNTYTNDASSFRPYVMGIYTGISYRF